MPIRPLIVARVLAAAAVALLAHAPLASAAPLPALAGTLHERDPRPDLFPDDPAASLLPTANPSGRFSWYAGTDLRSDPQAAVLETDTGGWAVAMAPESPRLLAPLRRDPESGLTLRPDAPEGAVCATGDEPDCWRPGDPPLGVEDIVDALCAAVGAAPDGCRFRENLGHAPLTRLDLASVENPTWFTPASPSTSAGLTVTGFTGFSGSFISGSLAGVDLLNSEVGTPGALEGFEIPTSPALSFASELAVVSFDFQLLLAAFSGRDVDGAPSDAFDPAHPFSTTSEGQCSFLQPQFCSAVQAFFFPAALQALPDDPFVTTHGRWLWEAGAELEIAAAGGELARFAGGKLFALGPERSRLLGPSDAGDDVGVTFLLASSDPASAPQLFFAAPEPQGGALAAAALATLLALSQRRRARG